MTTNAEGWKSTKERLSAGDIVTCTVTHHEPFGMFVAIENESALGLIERVRMIQDGYNAPTDYPPIGSQLKASVLGFRDYSRQVELAMPRKWTPSKMTTGSEEAIEVGLRMGDDGKLGFFGIDDVNLRIAAGNAVVRIEQGNAIMTKTGESKDSVKMHLRGFSVRLIVTRG